MLNYDRVAEASGQVFRNNCQAAAHRVHRRFVGVQTVDIDAAVAHSVIGRVSPIVGV